MISLSFEFKKSFQTKKDAQYYMKVIKNNKMPFYVQTLIIQSFTTAKIFFARQTLKPCKIPYLSYSP